MKAKVFAFFGSNPISTFKHQISKCETNAVFLSIAKKNSKKSISFAIYFWTFIVIDPVRLTCYQPIMLDVEAELAQLVAPQTELLADRPGTDGLEPGGDLGHVVSLPVLGVHYHTLALYKVNISKY